VSFTLTASLPKKQYVEYAILWRKIPIRYGVFTPKQRDGEETGAGTSLASDRYRAAMKDERPSFHFSQHYM
jgi:hypothetical protein